MAAEGKRMFCRDQALPHRVANVVANWSLSHEPWRALSAVLKEKPLSWSTIPFDANLANNVPHKPGIYLVCARPVAPLSASTPDLLNILAICLVDRVNACHNSR